MRDITPAHLKCTETFSCPCVFEHEGSLLINASLAPYELKSQAGINSAPGEVTVMIPVEYFRAIAINGTAGSMESSAMSGGEGGRDPGAYKDRP